MCWFCPQWSGRLKPNRNRKGGRGDGGNEVNDKEAVEGFAFEMRTLRRIRAEHDPESADNFLLLLEVWARNQLESDTLARQREQEAGSLRKDD